MNKKIHEYFEAQREKLDQIKAHYTYHINELRTKQAPDDVVADALFSYCFKYTNEQSSQIRRLERAIQEAILLMEDWSDDGGINRVMWYLEGKNE